MLQNTPSKPYKILTRMSTSRALRTNKNDNRKIHQIHVISNINLFMLDVIVTSHNLYNVQNYTRNWNLCNYLTIINGRKLYKALQNRFVFLQITFIMHMLHECLRFKIYIHRNGAINAKRIETMINLISELPESK